MSEQKFVVGMRVILENKETGFSVISNISGLTDESSSEKGFCFSIIDPLTGLQAFPDLNKFNVYTS